MRILHTSDWHLGRSLEQISRIDEQREFIDFLCCLADDEKIDLVLIAGDIYDTYNPSAAAEELFYEAVERLCNAGRRAVVVIAGNHDNPERLCAPSPLASKNGIILLGYPGSDAGKQMHAGEADKVQLVASGPGWLELHTPGCSCSAVLVTMPYPSESRLEEVLSSVADEVLLQKAYSEKIGHILTTLSGNFRDDTVNLVTAHMFMLGGSTSDSERTLQVGGALTVDPEVMPETAHYAALGHLHRPQEIKGGACPIFYAGSPLAYSFSEAKYSKAVYIVDAVPGEKAVVNPVYITCGKPLSRWTADKGIGQAVEWCKEGRDANAWIDLEIVTDRAFTSDEQKLLRSLNPGIINIRPKMVGSKTDLLNAQSREGRKIDELFSDFYTYRTGMEIPGELMETFLEVVNSEEEEILEGEVDDIETEAS